MTRPLKLHSFIWIFLRKRAWTFFIILLVSLAWALDATLWPYIFRKAIEIFTEYDLNRAAAWAFLKFPVIWGAALWLTIELCMRTQGFLLARAIPKLEADIRMAMFDHVQRHSPQYFNEHFAGSLANKITDMTTNVTLIVQETLYLLVPAFAACIIAVVLLFFVNPLFALVLGGWLIIHFSICFAFTPKCDELESLHGEARTSLLGRIVDSLTNNFTVNLFHRFAYEKARIGILQKEEQLKNTLSKRYVERMRVFLGLSSICIAGGILHGLMIYFWLVGKISTAEVVQIFNTAWNIIMMVWVAGMAIPTLFQSIGIAKQALSLMQDPQDILDAPQAKPLVVSKGEIVFDNVSFHYGEKQLFHNKDVHIQGGEKIGLVGYSGSGKSTFVNLILRFFPVEKGKIYIDGQEISTVTLESLRNQVALIPQDPLLFHRTLEENIRYGKIDSSTEEIKKVSKLAHCDEFIKKSPKGYASLVGERGTKLSGGERQRIAIARAMLAKAPILILDEATSALDSVTETYIQDSLVKLMQNRTTIAIAHRLSTLSKMDRILVFDKGKIVEEGTHDTLLALNGHYAHMWKMQAGGFLPDEPSR